MSTAAILALVVALNGAHTVTLETVATLPADQCLVSMRALWALPADTVAGAPTLDAYCEDPAKAPMLGVPVVRAIATP